MRSHVEPFRSSAWSRLTIVVAFAALVAGCSSEATRFNDGPFANPYTSRNSGPAPSADVTGSVNRPVQGSQIESRPLPQAQGGALPPPASSDVTGTVAARPQPAPASTAQRSGNWDWEGGTAVTLAPGDTLDTVAHRYGVPVSAIAQANGLAPNAQVHTGQRLVIPRYNYSGTPTRSASGPSTPAMRASLPAPSHPGSPNSPAPLFHVVNSGETLATIARRYGKTPREIAAANHFAPHRTVRIGDRIVIPGGRSQAVASVAPPAISAPAAQPAGGQRYVAAEPANSARMVTPAAEQPKAAEPEAAETTAATGGFRWPVRGRVIAGFGPKPTGQQNDGINLAVPEGTPVKAADDGVVAYAGSELKGYGNLVLVRHANGLVTAYAHASELMVKRGDTIKRGQVIAKSGQTGNVTSPQLHFEVRKGAAPVDPMQYLTGAT